MIDQDDLATCKQVGRNIKEIREKAKLTHIQLGDKAGLHFNYFARIERGEVNPSIIKIINIAKALNVKVSDILPF